MNKTLRNVLIATPIIAGGVFALSFYTGGKESKLEFGEAFIDPPVVETPVDTSTETLIESESTESQPVDTQTTDSSTNSINEVLANWNDTNAPMPIPIITDEDRKNADILPYLHDGTGLWGYLCDNNERVIEPQFAYAGAFYSDLAPVQLEKDGKIGFINKKGELVKEPFIDYIEFVSLDKKIMIVNNGYKYGIISLEGEIVKEIKFNSIDELAKDFGYDDESDLFYGPAR